MNTNRTLITLTKRIYVAPIAIGVTCLPTATVWTHLLRFSIGRFLAALGMTLYVRVNRGAR